MGQIAHLIQAVTSCASFACLFGVTRIFLFPAASLRLANHVISGLHAVLMLLLGVWAMWRGTISWELIGSSTPVHLEGVLCVSLGYFVYDLVCGWYIEYKTHSRNVANTIHHLVCTLGLSVAVLTGNSGTEVMACILLAETSTPFLHAHHILKELGCDWKLLISIVEVGFASTFFLFRIVLGPFLTWKTVISTKGSPTVKVVSIIWLHKILRIANSRIRKLE